VFTYFESTKATKSVVIVLFIRFTKWSSGRRMLLNLHRAKELVRSASALSFFFWPVYLVCQNQLRMENRAAGACVILCHLYKIDTIPGLQ